MSLLRILRTRKNWTQADLATHSCVPRSSIAAIENGKLVPSVRTALALARSLDCTVEELFNDDKTDSLTWAWKSIRDSDGYWKAAFNGKMLAFPVEELPSCILPPDGWSDGPLQQSVSMELPEKTLIMASCDPAAGFLANMMGLRTGIRVLSFHRSSREALMLLRQGVVHVAGTHLSEVDEPGGNAAIVQDLLGSGFCLLRGAVWEEGVTVRSGEGLTGPGKTVSEDIRWIGRKPGSGARRCQDKILADSKLPGRIALNHWEVAMAVRQGWVDAGVCHRFAASQAGLDFFQVSRETFDFCYPAQMKGDPRITALRKVVGSIRYRKDLAGFMGIHTRTTGEEETV